MREAQDHPQTVSDGGFRSRPYVGRYVPPPPPVTPARADTIAERIDTMLKAVKAARFNAHFAMREGDADKASAAFYRAHEYVEMVRELRARL